MDPHIFVYVRIDSSHAHICTIWADQRQRQPISLFVFVYWRLPDVEHDVNLLRCLTYYIYILSVVTLDETNISGCLHFSMQNIEMSCDLDRTSWRSNVNVSQ